MRPKLFSLYMAKRFVRPFLFGLGIFALLIFLGDMFDKMSRLIKSDASVWIIVQYLWLEVPYWAVRVIPMATLLATLVALTGFIESGEWIAAQASGFETRDFWKPILWCSLGVTALSFGAQETVLPLCFNRAQSLWRERIHPEWEWSHFERVALMVGPDSFLQAAVFLPKEGRLGRPILETVGEGGIERQVDAAYAEWDESARRWSFHDGVERLFADGKVTQRPFQRLESPLDVPPRNLIPRTRNPDEMSLRELRSYARRISLLGISRRELDVAIQGKISYPFTNFVMCALGIPLALRLRRVPRVASFCAALAVSFLYLWTIEIGRYLGVHGVLPAVAAAWLANGAFGTAAAVALRKSEPAV